VLDPGTVPALRPHLWWYSRVASLAPTTFEGFEALRWEVMRVVVRVILGVIRAMVVGAVVMSRSQTFAPPSLLNAVVDGSTAPTTR
jgi:hypothetical protein